MTRTINGTRRHNVAERSKSNSNPKYRPVSPAFEPTLVVTMLPSGRVLVRFVPDLFALERYRHENTVSRLLLAYEAKQPKRLAPWKAPSPFRGITLADLPHENT